MGEKPVSIISHDALGSAGEKNPVPKRFETGLKVLRIGLPVRQLAEPVGKPAPPVRMLLRRGLPCGSHASQAQGYNHQYNPYTDAP